MIKHTLKLLFIYLLLATNYSHAQSSIDIGGNIEGIINYTNGKFGRGQAAGIWGRKHINESNALKIALAYRQLAGLDIQYASFEERFMPNEQQLVLNHYLLTGLSYWDINVSWIKQLDKHPAWSVSFGTRLSKLHQTQGNITELAGYRIRDITVTASSESGSGLGSGRIRQLPVSTKYIKAYDFGLQLQLYYEISPGLLIHGKIDQGITNIFSAQATNFFSTHRLTNCALGFKAYF